MKFTDKVLKYAAEQDIYEDIYWDEDLNFYINCNDLFFWGCADSEDLTEADFDLLKQAYEDSDTMAGTLLYCCRKRNMRPQGAYYKYIEEEYWHLFDACGPEREVGLGNPHERMTREKYVASTNKPDYFKIILEKVVFCVLIYGFWSIVFDIVSYWN